VGRNTSLAGADNVAGQATFFSAVKSVTWPG
jgi:hypothetical protein